MAMVVLVTMAGFASKLNAQTCPTSAEVTIQIVAEPTVTTAGNVTVCVGGGGTITATPAGGAGTCSLVWEKRTGGSSGTWATITSNANETITGNNLVVTNVAATTEYRATNVCDGVGCDGVPSTPTVVTVVPDLSITTALADKSICVGGDGTLTFAVTDGFGTISYEWETFNTTTNAWVAAPGAVASSATYQADNTTPGTKRYRVRATATGNDCNATTYSEATVTVIEDLVITMSTPIIECIGSNQALTVTVSGGLNPTIVWQESTSATGTFTDVSPAQTGTTFTPPNAAANVGTKFYQAVVTSTGSGCAAPTPVPVSVQVLDVIGITLSSTPIVECVGGNQVLTPNITGISGAVTYQWQVADPTATPPVWTNAPGTSNQATYTPPNAVTDAGVKLYRIAVRHTGSDCADIFSTPVRVEVVPDLSRTSDIADIVECIGGTKQLEIIVAGGSNLTYTWEMYNGTAWVAAPGASTASNTYTPSSAASGATRYKVTVASASAGCDAITSREATVTVNPDISVTTAPVGFTECIGGTQALSVVAEGGTAPLAYQWGTVAGGTFTPISGETGTSFTPPSTSAAITSYQVRIRSANNADVDASCGEVFTTPVNVEVVARPTVAVAAPPAALCIGGSVTLTATPSGGTGTCVIYWQRPAASPAGSFEDIPGATGPTYTIPTTQTGTAGEVKVKARLQCSGNGCCN